MQWVHRPLRPPALCAERAASMQGTPAPGWPARPLQLPQRHKSPSALSGSYAVGTSFRSMARPVVCLLHASPPSPSDLLPEQGRIMPHSLHELLAHKVAYKAKSTALRVTLLEKREKSLHLTGSLRGRLAAAMVVFALRSAGTMGFARTWRGAPRGVCCGGGGGSGCCCCAAAPSWPRWRCARPVRSAI